MRCNPLGLHCLFLTMRNSICLSAVFSVALATTVANLTVFFGGFLVFWFFGFLFIFLFHFPSLSFISLYLSFYIYIYIYLDPSIHLESCQLFRYLLGHEYTVESLHFACWVEPGTYHISQINISSRLRKPRF